MNYKTFSRLAFVVLATISLGACGNQSAGSTGDTIEVVSRESGSGTRDAFTELTGVLVKEGDKKNDQTTNTAIIQNNTEGVLSTVSGNPRAIGYISLGSLNDKVKALKIEGVAPTSETISNESYAIQRPFNIVWNQDSSALTKDFIQFITSKEGQEIVTENKYVEAHPTANAYQSQKLSGKISIVGSTSVTPLMEKIAETYKKENPDVIIDITANGSSAGLTAVQEKTADIGMLSRKVNDAEAQTVQSEKIALDGIAIVVHPDSQVETVRLEQLRDIFTGKMTTWSELD